VRVYLTLRLEWQPKREEKIARPITHKTRFEYRGKEKATGFYVHLDRRHTQPSSGLACLKSGILTKKKLFCREQKYNNSDSYTFDCSPKEIKTVAEKIIIIKKEVYRLIDESLNFVPFPYSG
jgi:hypothetical protein